MCHEDLNWSKQILWMKGAEAEQMIALNKTWIIPDSSPGKMSWNWEEEFPFKGHFWEFIAWYKDPNYRGSHLIAVGLGSTWWVEKEDTDQMACIITSSGDCKCITSIIGSLKKERDGIWILNKNLVDMRHCGSHLPDGGIASQKIRNLLMEIMGVIKTVLSSIWS